MHHPLATNAASELNWLPVRRTTHDGAGDNDDGDNEWGQTGNHRKSPLPVVVVVAVAAAATFSDALFGAASFYRGTQAVSMV